MQTNNVQLEEKRDIPLLRIVYRNIVLIIITTIIGLLGGLAFGVMVAKPTYVVSKRVMFVASYNLSGNTPGNDMILAQIYLPNAVDKLRSPLFIVEANKIYNASEGDSISASSINSEFAGESLIFSISYVDTSAEKATKKLEAIIESAKQNFPKPEVTVAKNATLKEVENSVNVVKKSNTANYIVAGAVLGIVVSVAFVIIRYLLDNTIKDRADLEKLTGVMLLSTVEDLKQLDEENKKRQRKRKK